MSLGIGLGVSRPGGSYSPVEFRSGLMALLGGDIRLLWLPQSTDTTTATSFDPLAKTITWDATVAARLSALGRGTQQSFVSASSQTGSTPNADSLRFGNGIMDSAFSVVALVNVTDTAAARRIAAKYNVSGTLREWLFGISTTDTLVLALYDESLDVQPSRASDAAITQGSMRLLGATYSAATGGATAANDVTLYQDGAVIASTATNAGTYVAMEGTTAPVTIGSLDPTTGQFLDGSVAMVAIVGGALTAAQMLAVKQHCTIFFGVP